jgi:hypothetical protein
MAAEERPVSIMAIRTGSAWEFLGIQPQSSNTASSKAIHFRIFLSPFLFLYSTKNRPLPSSGPRNTGHGNSVPCKSFRKQHPLMFPYRS